MVQFVNRIIEDDDKGCPHVVQNFSAILIDLTLLLGNALFGFCEPARWDIKECSHIQCVNPLLRVQQSLFRTGQDVSRVSIQLMVIILDSLGARNKFGAELPEATETSASWNFFDQTNGMYKILWCIFHHADFRAVSIVV